MRALQILIGGTVCLSILFLAACGPTTEPVPPTAHEEITVMTYNILMGAGVDTVPPWAKEFAAQKGYPGNRLPRVLEVIKAAEPDILGIQEAPQWDIGSPSVAQQVADELGMNYFIGESINDALLHVVLFTKFDIKEAESYSIPFTNAGIRAELITPGGESIHVFVAHLYAKDPRIKTLELWFTLLEMDPYIDDLAIIMGDMNFFYRWGLKLVAERLLNIQPHVYSIRAAGWRHCTGQWVDHIWASPALALYAQPGPKISSELTEGTSDHEPVIAKFRIPQR